MAFPTYQYPGYQPYYGQPVPDQLAQLRQNQMLQQPVPQQMQPVMPPTQMGTSQIQPAAPQNNGIIWVSSRQEADGYLIAPGSAVALWDSNAPVIYLRQADNTGKPSTKVYDLVERTDMPAARQQPVTPQIDLSRFVTIDQLEEILAERLKRPVKVPKAKEEESNG